MRKKVFISFVSLFFFLCSARGQNIIISNGTVSSCGGNFYDTGNSSGNYGLSENYTFTICSDVPGKCVSLQFLSFDLENNFDFLYVYNGPSVSSPLMGAFTGSNSPGTITATSGCLTIKFISDYTVSKSGWAAIMSCVQCPVNGCPTCNGGIPPVNDACSNAQNLGTLPIPSACPAGIGPPSVFNTSNICATPEIPYNALQGCNPIGNMATPASDVWYKFTITAPILKIIINGMITPEVGLYSGTGCGNLVPRGCAIGGGGLLNATFSGLAAGTYYLQISGGTLSDQCNFTLSIQNNLDCQGCVTQSSFTATPSPTNGIYLAGQTVNFCLQITGYLPSSANWLHAVIPSFGSGWDTSTISASAPLSCSGNGNWDWYDHSVTSTANASLSVGPGFFYETSAGNSLGVADTNPGNNFGDNLSNNCTLNFCFSIKTKRQFDCVQGQNLNVFIDTYGDGETGSWSSVACASDPINDFYANLACCIPPTLSVTNPVCNGQLGSAVGTGLGIGPWTYQWKNSAGTIIRTASGAGTDQILNLASGNYSLVTIDATGCNATTTFVISEPQRLFGTIVVNSTKCALDNGVISFSALGGTAPYSFSINNGVSFQAANIFRNLAAGNYNIIIKDARQCMWDTVVSIASSTFPVINNISTQDITCYNGDDGVINISAAGGTTPYSYSIDSGATYQSLPLFASTLMADTYNIIVSDAQGCKATSTVTLSQPPPVDLQVVVKPASCTTNDGTIQLNVLSGTTGVLSYSITNGQSYQASNLFTGLAPGSYLIVVEDQNGCLTRDTAIVNNLNAPTINGLVVTNLTCYQSSNGNIVINASGGVGVIQYSINGGVSYSTSNTFNNLNAGTYSIIIKDQNNCRSNTSVIITEPIALNIRADVYSTKCGLSNASFTLYSSNGVLPLQFSIDGGLSWQSSPTFINLPSGVTTGMIKDANGCIVSHGYQINASSAPALSSLNITNVACNGTSTGAVVINAAGGIAPIRFSIDSGITYYTTNVFNSLSAGTYNIVLKDNASCISNSVFTIAQPPQINLITTHTDAQCGLPNGSITAIASGGAGVFSYSNDGGLTFGSSNYFNNLSAGSYKVVVLDANGCVEATTVIINDALGPRIIDVQVIPQLCDGVSNGSISLEVVSGTGILQYSIDNGITFSNNPDFQNLPPGNYQLYVKDEDDCYDSDNVDVPILHSPQINLVDATHVICNGDANGTVSISASGGNGMLNYSIDNGINYFTSNNFNALSSGTYYILVSDSNNCSVTDSVTISQPEAITLSSVLMSEKCNRNDGSILVHVSGGVPFYLFSFNYSPYNIDSNFTALDSGYYSIYVMDNNGCVDSVFVDVELDGAPQIDNINISNILCNDVSEGTITINASGGSGTLLFSNDNGFSFQNSNAFNNLGAGSYAVAVIDSNNCRTDSIVTIIEPAPFVFSFQTTNSNCNINNGSISVTASGGTGILSYSLNSGTFTSDTIFTNLGAGNYTITVKDQAGCMKDFVASVSNYNGPLIQSVNTTNLACNGADIGTISITASGGTGSLSYSIDDGVSFTNAASYVGLSAGLYNIVVVDAVGCESNSSVTITEPDAISISYQIFDATCGQSNGKIILDVSGGIGPYQYSIDSLTYVSIPVFNNLIAGTYQIIVKDANDCIASKSISIDNLLAPSITAVVTTHLNCYEDGGGEISVSAIGGTGNLSYSVDNGATYQQSGIFSSLIANTYIVIVSDTNNCLADTIVTLTEPNEIIATVQSVTANCNRNNGSLEILAAGGTGTLSYSLDQINFSANNLFNNLYSGNYTLTVRDIRGCTKDIACAVNNINGPVIQSILVTDLRCKGNNLGAIRINSNAGTGNLSYSIDNGVSFQSTGLFTNLPAGNYNVVVKDDVGCLVDSSVIINEPLSISINTQTSNPACGQNNGSITLAASGGTGALIYSIDSINFQSLPVFSNLFAGTYSVFVNDANNCLTAQPVSLSNLFAPTINSVVPKNLTCFNDNTGQLKIFASGGTGSLTYSIDNGISFQPSNIFNSLSSGLYFIRVNDANNCAANTTELVSEPDSLFVISSFVNETCSKNNGSIMLQGTGGTAPYLFSSDSGLVFTGQTSYTALNNGNFYLVVKDSKGCKSQKQVLLNDLTGPTITNYLSNSVNCFGGNDGSISITTSGGNGTLLYSLGLLSQHANAFPNLAAGSYFISVNDTNNCRDSAIIAVAQPPKLSFSKAVSNLTCFDSHDGNINIIANGGTPDYDITWSNGVVNSFTNSNLVAGGYYFTISDANSCNVSDSIFLTQPEELVITYSSVNGTCASSADASAMVEVTGGVFPYTYDWSPVSSNTNYINNLVAGNYTVSITDANGCSKNHTILISNPASLTLQMQTRDVSCYNGNNGSVVAFVGGGTPPYAYNWHEVNESGNMIDSLLTGFYGITVTDYNGCTISDTSIVSSPSQVSVTGIIENVSCHGFANGSIDLSVSGGIFPYLFTWSNGAIISNLQNLAAGTYNVTITDANICEKTISYLIDQPEKIFATSTFSDTICIGQQTMLSCEASGGRGHFSYLWSNGASVQNILVSPELTTIFTVQATDSSGCASNIDTSMVFVHSPLKLIVSPGDVICRGENVSISAVASGGNGGPYFYSWYPLNSTTPQANVRPDSTTTYIASASDHCTVLPAIDSLTIIVNPLPIIQFSAIPTEGCIPLEVHFTNQSIAPGGSWYDWNFGDGSKDQAVFSPTHTYTTGGSYDVTLTVTTPQLCTAHVTIPDLINAYSLPEADFSVTPKSASIFNPRISFTDQSSSPAFWNWNFGDGIGLSEIQNPVYIYADTGKFNVQLIVTSEHFCVDTTMSEVFITGEYMLYIPNTFTPNNDGNNDFFFIMGYDFIGLQLEIFNRWGEKVFEGNNASAKWNGKQNNTGKDCPEGVYVYKLQTVDFNNKTHLYQGKVNLLR